MHCAPREVDLQALEFESPRRLRRATRTAEHSLQTRQQFARLEGLGHRPLA